MSERQASGVGSGTAAPRGVDAVMDEPRLPGLVVVAEILGTVDLERALASIADPLADVGPPATDPLLGARVIVIRYREGQLVALAEPSTEGRLAASLARHGEGLVGWYASDVDDESLAMLRRRAAAAGVRISRPEVGPLGPSALILDRPVTGPHLVVVERRSLPSGR